MNPYMLVCIFGFVAGATSVALSYEPRYRVRFFLWTLFIFQMFMTLGWRMYGYFHPEKILWPFA